MATVHLQGNAVNTSGDLPAKGASAPDFKLTNGELKDKTLSDFAGKKKVLNIFPSVDTPTCALSVKQFNNHAAQHSDVVMLQISADLPFAQGRFCGDNGLENVETLSMMRDRSFAQDYGTLLVDGPLAGLSARAVVVLDENNSVLHSQLVNEIADEPDYEAALASLG
ncbi:MAG: lipid hydroperoxide peroxidase [Salinisphaeraceae bacterium]|jgi:thiol peroxidase|nr:lipid hydroperoxide peroxidase [Salinisphaeraceae bacterium]